MRQLHETLIASIQISVPAKTMNSNFYTAFFTYMIWQKGTHHKHVFKYVHVINSKQPKLKWNAVKNDNAKTKQKHVFHVYCSNQPNIYLYKMV